MVIFSFLVFEVFLTCQTQSAKMISLSFCNQLVIDVFNKNLSMNSLILGFKARVGSHICSWQRPMCCMFLRFTSGATPATSWWPAWQLIPSRQHTCEQAIMGLKTGTDLWCCHSVLNQADALSTELYQLGIEFDNKNAAKIVWFKDFFNC